jgi:GT2 family glycosyltransferase
MRRADLISIGGFDEDFFLYYEEDILAFRLARLGGGAIYEPRALVEHSGGASTRLVGAHATHHLYRSRVVFYRKRYSDIRGRLIGLMLAVGAMPAVAGTVANALLGRNRATTPSQVWQALRGILAGTTARLHQLSD